jgi:hypothetical protein
MKNLWQTLGMTQARITKLENKILAELQPPMNQERALPFFESSEVEFNVAERNPTEQTITLVQDANRETRITSLSYLVEARIVEGGGAPNIVVPLQESAYGAEFNGELLFDFDWNFEMGRTNTSYANGRVEGQPRGLSRQSLGYVGNNENRGFSEKNPLILRTNEFFKIKLKPTFVALAGGGPDVTSFIVTFQAAGWQTFSSN